METLLNKKFLNSIVVVNSFKLDSASLNLNLLCIEGPDTEVNYRILLENITYFIFRQEDFNSQFDVIDTFLEKFNDCSYVEFMRSEQMKDFWVLRFHSGIHHLIVGFNTLQLSKI